MSDIPNVLQSSPMALQGHHHRNTIDAITNSKENPGGSGITLAGHGSAADGLDWADIADGDERATGIVEYPVNDAHGAGEGEESRKTNGALVIQRAARRYILKRMQENFHDTLTKARNRCFRVCKASANTVHARYRKTYLGPVPHLILCLGWIVTRAQASMNIAMTQSTDMIDRQMQMRLDMKYTPPCI
jgi:hypothetical protein